MGRFTKNIVFNGYDSPGQFYAIGLTDLPDLALIVGRMRVTRDANSRGA